MRTSLLLVAALAACDAYDTDLGPTPFLCGQTDPRCPIGYSCQTDALTGDEICVGEGDSLSADFDCADDSAYEPNGMVAEATATSIDTMSSFTLGGLAICPVGDKDLFAINASVQNTNIEVVVDYEVGGAVLQAALLNAGGVPIATADPVSGTRQLRLFAQNLPAGAYYAQVSAPVMETISVNNYSIEINSSTN